MLSGTLEVLTKVAMLVSVVGSISAMGLGLSWVIPFNNALGFMVGALVICGWELLNRKSADKYSIPLASGLIAGESLIKAIIAMTATVVGLMAGT